MYAERAMSQPIPTLLTKPANDAPWWVLPILTFVFGVAMTASVLYPIAATPDYNRGHAAGFREGKISGDEGWTASVKDAFESGRRAGLAECAARH